MRTRAYTYVRQREMRPARLERLTRKDEKYSHQGLVFALGFAPVGVRTYAHVRTPTGQNSCLLHLPQQHDDVTFSAALNALDLARRN